MTQEDFEILVDLGGLGDGEAKYWTCDFSYVSGFLFFLLILELGTN